MHVHFDRHEEFSSETERNFQITAHVLMGLEINSGAATMRQLLLFFVSLLKPVGAGK
jgi:hypothetical protein